MLKLLRSMFKKLKLNGKELKFQFLPYGETPNLGIKTETVVLIPSTNLDAEVVYRGKPYRFQLESKLRLFLTEFELLGKRPLVVDNYNVPMGCLVTTHAFNKVGLMVPLSRSYSSHPSIRRNENLVTLNHEGG